MITVDFNRIPLPRNARILDIGCGQGRHMVRAAQEKGTHCTGGDFGFDNLLETREKLRIHENLHDLSARSWHLTCLDITALPFEDACFDLVVCAEVLEHIPGDATALSELARVVKPGRFLAVSVPRFWPEKICWSLSEAYHNADMGHIRIYRKKDLVQKVNARGFTLTHCHYAHSIHSPYWWLKCLVGPDRTDSAAVNLYHRLLVWDLMAKPRITAWLDRLFNPILGKSLVLYFQKTYDCK